MDKEKEEKVANILRNLPKHSGTLTQQELEDDIQLAIDRILEEKILTPAQAAMAMSKVLTAAVLHATGKVDLRRDDAAQAHKKSKKHQ